ncbi:hydrophobin [Epithele typhae]|uniref:hydrophobin n=1 Tax=Epithele typhae TaxID=378194 RepID=UPI0020088EE6|nr:hydrophobin [Epithele typhae]KAH9915294.1 hydrophobin [Epithele typhae]
MTVASRRAWLVLWEATVATLKASRQASALRLSALTFRPSLIAMFARLAVVSTLVFAALAVATKCTTGPSSAARAWRANSAAGSAILAAIGATLQNTNMELGLKCSPIDVVAVGSGNACTTNTVCCKNNNIGGGVSAGCVPVTL